MLWCVSICEIFIGCVDKYLPVINISQLANYDAMFVFLQVYLDLCLFCCAFSLICLFGYLLMYMFMYARIYISICIFYRFVFVLRCVPLVRNIYISV